MTDWVLEVGENGISALPRDIQQVLQKIESMPGNPARSMMRREGFYSLKEEKFRKGRQVWGHEDTDGLVYKVAVDNGHWQNEVEARIWFDQRHPSYSEEVPTEAMEYICPILDSHINSGSDYWLIMPEAEMGSVELSDAINLIEEMKDTGWIVTDYHYGNIGYLDGRATFVDYGQMKPVRFLDDDWRERIKSKDGWA